jgi:hypothetical protein
METRNLKENDKLADKKYVRRCQDLIGLRFPLRYTVIRMRIEPVKLGSNKVAYDESCAVPNCLPVTSSVPVNPEH